MRVKRLPNSRVINNVNLDNRIQKNDDFGENAQIEFLKGAKIAYETIITDFSDNDNKINSSKSLVSKKVFDQFEKALKERDERGHYAEITFIGINSAKIIEHKKVDKVLQLLLISLAR